MGSAEQPGDPEQAVIHSITMKEGYPGTIAEAFKPGTV